MKLRLGMSPISWTNDDLPQLGGDTPLEVCLGETRAAGYVGTEMGGKFPRDPATLSALLARHDLALVGGWYGGALLHNGLDVELPRIAAQLALFKTVGASVIVYGEAHRTIQNQQGKPMSQRPQLADFDLPAYARRLTALAEHCLDQGMPLAFHHHMGTAVETESELDALMDATGTAVGLTLDTGHLAFAGGDSAAVIAKHGHRIRHVHVKDIRTEILNRIDRNSDSFLDCVLRGAFTVPGDGSLDCGDLMHRLYDVGYEGWVVVEAEQDPSSANPLEYAKIGYNALHKALHEAGYGLA